jgi:streptogramin lyase
MDLHPGDVFAGHRIEGVAGRGGMGIVYRAVQESLDRVVALKTIAPALAADPSFSARFVRESKAAAAVEHPNVIPIFSAGEEDGVLYIVMRYVDGPDLRSVIRTGGPLPPGRAASIVAQVAAALDAAHARGLVHRDVKPANVLLDRADHAYLTDFGLTKRTHSTATATRAGGWVGTLGYVAPEQIRDQRVDARTDVYALGCVLFHALTGAAPYDRSSDEATLWAHLNDAPPDLPPGVPAGFVAAVHRALAKAPDERYDSAGAFGRAVLEAAGRPADSVAGLDRPAVPGPAFEETRITPPEARPDATAPTGHVAAPATAVARPASPPAVPPPPRRRPALLFAAAALLAGAAAAVIAVAAGSDDPPDRQATAPAPRTTPGPLRAQGVRVGSRPNGVAIARGSAYVSLPRSERLVRVDLESFERRPQGPRVGRGSLDVDAGFGALWTTTSSAGQALVRYDLDARRRTATPLPAGTPVAVEAGEGAVWVGIRGARMRAFPRSKVVRVDARSGRITKEIDIPRGLQDIAIGSGAVWITNRALPSITRLDVRTGALTTAPVGRGPAGVAVGGGSVWVANAEESTVSRLARRDLRDRATIGVEGTPRGVAYGGGSLWAASFATSTLTRIDARSGRPVGDPVALALNPTKVTVSRGAVYTVSPAGGELQRVRFR